MNNDQVSSAVWFIVGLAICLVSFHYKLGSPSSPGSGFMPFLAGAAICFFSLMGFISATIKRKRGEKWLNFLRNLHWERAFVILTSLVAYGLLLKPLGFFLCTTLLIGFLLRAFHSKQWSRVVGGALLTAAASYLIFDVWLKTQLPKGLFGI